MISKAKVILPLVFLFLLNNFSLFSQTLKPDLRNIFKVEEPSIDSVEISLEEYNKSMADSKLDQISKDDPLVRPNNTVMMYFEVPVPEESEEPMEVNLPEKNATLFDPKFKSELENTTFVGSTISGLSFDTEAGLSGFYHIPPDPSGAVGTTHVCHVVNTAIHCQNKTTGVAATGFPKSMSSFFTSLSPANAGFDPKILWDQYENRFVVVHLVKTTTAGGDASDSSRALLAVSDGADPTGTWNFQAIDTKQTISTNDCWFDYPGFAVGEEAVYITGNYFRLSNNASCESSNIIIVDKGVSGGIYDGTVSADEDPSTNSDFAIYRPSTEAGAGFNGTLQPALTFGSTGTSIDTWLVSYSGLSNGTNEAFEFYKISNPLTSLSITRTLLFVGNIDDTAASILDAPQSGSVTNIATNDRRSMGAVWRNNKLWMVTQVMPPSGTNMGQTTALWSRFTTSGTAISMDQAGEIGGEDISTGAYTFMPSIAINSTGNAGVVFSASNSSIFPGAYAVGIYASTGTLTASETIQAGTDDYVRTFGGDNRYGDYSGTAIDPTSGSFWGINQAAITNGTPLSSEDGRWQIFLKELDFSTLLPVEFLSFDIRAENNTALLNWETLSEINNEGFIIEQYLNNEFKDIGFKTGKGNTSLAQSYDFVVPDLPGGTHLFRLRQMDFDGSSSLSEVKSIELEGTIKNTISLARPNPFNQETRFTIEVGQDQPVTIEVYDINGRLVESLGKTSLEKDREYPFIFEADALPNGMYAIRVSGPYLNEVVRVILER